MKRLLYCLGLLLIVSLLTGCAADTSSVPMNYRWANVEGSQLNEAQAGEQFYFNILVDESMIESGVPITIKLSGNVNSGSLRFELRDPQGQAVWNSGTIGAGDFSIQTEYSLLAGRTGTYQLGMVYGENISAMYNLGWHAIQLGPSILLPGLGMILVSLAFVIYAASRKILGWKHLGMGALFWVLTVAVKFIVAIPVNPLLFRMLGVSYETIFSPANLIYYLYIGALTGIFEAGLAWLILSRTRWGKANWNQALVFGIGFGVIEAFLLGGMGMASALVGMFSPDALPISALGGLANNATLSMALAPVCERLFVIFAHIFACVLIFHAINSGEAKWGWLAVLYKTLLDAPAGFAAFWGVGTTAKLWTIEGIIAIFGLIGLWGTIWIARRYTQSSIQPSTTAVVQ
jgi:uncharacterized membrane protein YhfC